MTSPRPALQRDATVAPSPASAPPSHLVFPRLQPPSPEPPRLGSSQQDYGSPVQHQPADARTAGSPHRFAPTPSPYESPYIPPPTPTPPDVSPYDGILDEDDSPDEHGQWRPLGSVRQPFGDDELDHSELSYVNGAASRADGDDDDDDTPDGVLTADFEAVAVPMLPSLVSASQPASFPMDQRSSDLTTISEERSSRMSRSTRSNSLLTSSAVGAGGPRDSTFSGGWETLEGGGLRRAHAISGGGRHDATQAVKTSTWATTGRVTLTDDAVPVLETEPLAASVPAAWSAPSMPDSALGLLAPNSHSSTTTPSGRSHDSLSTSSAVSTTRQLSPAEQIVAAEAHRTPRHVRQRSLSASELTPAVLAALSASADLSSSPPTRRPVGESPARPPRSAQRPLSYGGSPPPRPDVVVAPPSDELLPSQLRRPSFGRTTGSTLSSPAAALQTPFSRASLSVGGSSATLQPLPPPQGRSHSHSPSSTPASADSHAQPASSSSVASIFSSAALTEHARSLDGTAADLARHGAALNASAAEMARHARALQRLSSSTARTGENEEEDDPGRMLEGARMLFASGAEIVGLALDIGQRALERAEARAKAAQAEVDRARETLAADRAGLERAREAFVADKQREADHRRRDDDARAAALALAAGGPSAANLARPTTKPSRLPLPSARGQTVLSPGRLVESPMSTSPAPAHASPPERAPTASPASSPWRLFGSSTSAATLSSPAGKKLKQRRSSSPDKPPSSAGGGTREGRSKDATGAPARRSWGLKRRDKSRDE